MWGHYITDCIRFLWFLNSNEYKNKFKEYKLVGAQLWRFKFKGNFKRIFEILGINCDEIELVREITRYDEIVIPDECFMRDEQCEYNRLFTKEYVELVDKIRNYAIEHKTPTDCKKIYYSDSNKRTQIGENVLEEYFKSKGYKIIHPEKLSLDQQLNYLINCESFASTVGSISHNILFLPNGTNVILIPRLNSLNRYQLALNQIHNLNITYIDSSLSLFGRYVGNFYYFISKQLVSYFGDEIKNNNRKYLRENFKNFKKYLSRIFIYLHDGIDETTYDYYFNKTDTAKEYIQQLADFENTFILKRISKFYEAFIYDSSLFFEEFEENPLVALKKVLRQIKKLVLKIFKKS